MGEGRDVITSLRSYNNLCKESQLDRCSHGEESRVEADSHRNEPN